MKHDPSDTQNRIERVQESVNAIARIVGYSGEQIKELSIRTQESIIKKETFVVLVEIRDALEDIALAIKEKSL